MMPAICDCCGNTVEVWSTISTPNLAGIVICEACDKTPAKKEEVLPEPEDHLTTRIVSCKGWRWMVGMKLEDGRRIVGHTEDGRELLFCSNGKVGCFGSLSESECLPDLSDPVTGGLILHLLAELCSTQTDLSSLSSGTDEWEVWTIRGRSSGSSLGEAAARAILLLD